MPSRQLSYGDLDYWEERFRSELEPFEWLQDGSALDKHIGKCLSTASIADGTVPLILHIGCGSSEMPARLRNMVKSPQQVYNIDASKTAITKGKEAEQQLYTGQLHGQLMHWELLDLLDLHNVLSFSNLVSRQFSMIVDKATSDSIACCEHVKICTPYALQSSDSMSMARSDVDQPRSSALVDPVELLAIHLAFLCRHGGQWIVLSYSSERYAFLESDRRTSAGSDGGEDILPTGLWRVLRRVEVEIPKDGLVEDVEPTVHRPVIRHTVHVLERTDKALVYIPR